jgi:hypothetical protein
MMFLGLMATAFVAAYIVAVVVWIVLANKQVRDWKRSQR